MLAKLRKQTQGFTIIEVLIVLAIAGLIILIVFLAVPALQRNSRNTRVRNDASKALGAIQETANNNNGTLAATTTTPNALAPANANYSQITAVDYEIHASSFQATPGTLVRDTLYIRNFSICTAGSGGQTGVTGGTARQVTVTYLIESPGATATGKAPAGFVSQCTAQ